LEGVEDPEQKRKIIGNTFINVFEAEAAKLEAAAEAEEQQEGVEKKGRVEWLLQGTLYPDVIESISLKGPSATIKTHHNVGGLLKDMKLKLIEPLRELFKGMSFPSVLFGEKCLILSQMRFGPSVVYFQSQHTLFNAIPSLDLVLLSASLVLLHGNKSGYSNTPMQFTSTKLEKLVFTIRSVRHLQFSFL
jgi:hypothetical protein